LENPEAGIEINFDRLSRNAYLHRSQPYHATRSTVVVEAQDDQVVLRFPTEHGDDSVFRGSFVNADTLRGRFTNASRGEDFAMDLVSADSALGQARSTPSPVLAQRSESAVLEIEAFDDQGNEYDFGFGLGYYYSPGDGVVWGTLPPGGNPDLLTTNAVSPTAVIQMAFFPSWISFDIYTDDSQLEYLATFEVRMADFASLNPSDPDDAKGIEVYKSSQIGVFPDDVSVARCSMRYIASDEKNNSRIGNFPLGTLGEVEIAGQGYRVPRAVAALLAGFQGVERLPDPVVGPAPIAQFSYLNVGPVNLIRFDSSGSSDPAGGPLTYFWDFDDNGSTSTEANPTHLFNPGVHNVKLTVTNQQGVTDSARVTIGF
jgi:hypothetical protein